MPGHSDRGCRRQRVCCCDTQQIYARLPAPGTDPCPHSLQLRFSEMWIDQCRWPELCVQTSGLEQQIVNRSFVNGVFVFQLCLCSNMYGLKKIHLYHFINFSGEIK